MKYRNKKVTGGIFSGYAIKTKIAVILLAIACCDMAEAVWSSILTDEITGQTWYYVPTEDGVTLMYRRDHQNIAGSWVERGRCVTPCPSGSFLAPNTLTIPRSGGEYTIYDVTEIGEYAFAYSGITSFQINKKCLRLGLYAFMDCGDLSHIDFSLCKLTNIGAAFPGCSNLTQSISIPEGQTEIAGHTFRGCKRLSGVTIPQSVSAIGESAFKECESIGSFALPAMLKQIGASAFRKCTSLKSIAFSDSLWLLGSYAFNGCTNLASITFGDGALEIGSQVFGDTAIKTLAFPGDQWLELRRGAFYNIKSLTDVDFGNRQLYLSGLSSDRNGNALFGNCRCLTNIVIHGDAPTSETGYYNGIFDSDVPDDLVIHIEAGTFGWDGNPLSDDVPEKWPSKFNPDGFGKVSRALAFFPIELTFDPNGGTVEKTFGTYIPRTPFTTDDFPTPTREGYVFRGWFTEQEGGEIYTKDSCVPDRSGTLYAHWMPEGGFNNPVRITFDADGGRVSVPFLNYEAGEAMDVIPVPKKGGKTFMGWFTQRGGSTLVDNDGVAPLTSETWYARWADGVWRYQIKGDTASISGAADYPVEAYPSDMTTPPFLGGYPVVEIDDYAFCGGSNHVYSLIVSPGVTNIGSRAFLPSFYLTNVVLASSVQRIGDYAFSYSPELSSLTFDYRIGEIGDYAFSASSMITNVLVSTNTIIGANAFCENCVIHRAEAESEILHDVLPDGKELFVPREWIEGEGMRSLYDDGDTAASVLKKTTGKHDGSGKALCVWHDYVAGTDPTNENSVFSTSIEMIDGLPRVTWKPDLETKRTYKIWGSTNLANGGDWECPTNALHRFFKVTVDMP